MAKRRRVVGSSSEAESNGYEPARTKRVQRKPRTAKTAKPKLTKRTAAADNASDDDGTNIATADQRPHAVTLHEIAEPEAIRVALLAWYDQVHTTRGMPWRKPYNPDFGPEERAQRAYEVWVSEIMLQQTQVATVIPYYNKWMKKFPTIRDLAASDIETVNGLWKGLGYYSRAARLLSGAQKVVKDLRGRLPDNAKDMEAKIPGIGRYSAGAICSIAYNQCVPVLDGNVHRLLSRVLALHAPPKVKQTLDILWNAATAMVEGTHRPGDINQAMIELGSTVCKVREPACETCPIRPWCQAYAVSRGSTKADEVPDIEELCALCEPLPVPEGNPGLVNAFPMKADRKKAREELDIVNVIEWRSSINDDGRWFLLVRRPETGLLAGLHEFPTKPDVPADISAAETAQIPQALLSSLLKKPPLPLKPRKSNTKTPAEDPLRIVQIKSAGDVLHVFSHIRKTYRVQWVVLEGGAKCPELLPFCVPSESGVAKVPRGRTKKPKQQDVDSDSDAVQITEKLEARWLPLTEVAKANIGTGVLKVWNKANELWQSV